MPQDEMDIDATSASKGWKVTLINLALTAASLLLVFMMAEAVFRVRAYYEDRTILSQEVLRKLPLARDERVNFGHILALNPNNSLVFDLKPNIDVELFVIDRGAHIKLNSKGQRDHEYPLAKPPGTVRIFGVGDSFMFGLGVPNGKDYTAFVEADLNMKHPEKDWELINASVPGYNTVMEVELLRVKGLPYRPDIVMVGYYRNDTQLPSWVRNKENYLSLRKSFAKEYVLTRLGYMEERWELELVPAPDREGKRYATLQNSAYPDRPEDAPAEYRHLVGRENMLDAIVRLGDISRREAFDVVFVVLNDMRASNDEEVMRTASEQGFLVVDTWPHYEEFMKARGIERFKGSMLSISPVDPHPSAFAHRMAADIILGEMQKSGLIAKHLRP